MTQPNTLHTLPVSTVEPPHTNQSGPDAKAISQILSDAEYRINMILLEVSKALDLPVEVDTRDISTYGMKGPASVVALRVTVRS